MNFEITLDNHILEYYEDEHLYLVDGIIVPSITEMMRLRFGGKYTGIREDVLAQAARRGTEVHEAVQKLIETGKITDIPEVRGYKFLAKHYGFTATRTEEPVILFHGDIPIAAGRYDLEISEACRLGGADIKTTSTLDKEYLSLQLNLYRIANRQTYNTEWEFLKGIHLRGDTRKYVDIPINEELTNQFIEEFLKERKDYE